MAVGILVSKKNAHGVRLGSQSMNKRLVVSGSFVAGGLFCQVLDRTDPITPIMSDNS